MHIFKEWRKCRLKKADVSYFKTTVTRHVHLGNETTVEIQGVISIKVKK